MANPRRSVRSLSLSRRSVLLLLSVFVLCFSTYQLQIAFHSSKILEHEEDTEFQNAAIVFKLHSKYPNVPSTEIASTRRLRTLLERDLKRLGSKAATISAKRAALAVKRKSVVFPAHGNAYPDGLYYAEVYIGSPPKMFYLDMDTGSELTWLQCDAPCRRCANVPNGLYPYGLGEAELVDCRHAICAKIQTGRSFVCEVDLDGLWTQCDYEMEYADGSYTMGVLISDSITLFLSNGRKKNTETLFGYNLGTPQLSIHRFGVLSHPNHASLCSFYQVTHTVSDMESLAPNKYFKVHAKFSMKFHSRCGYDQSGTFAKDPILTDGVMGLSDSPASLPSQLAQKGVVKNVIGECVGSNGGYLFFGEALIPLSGMMWVPMVGGLRKFGHYQVRLRRIQYGGNELNVNGAIDEFSFDSGASFTYFVPELYDVVLSAVLDEVKRWNLVRQQFEVMPYCWSNNPLFQFSMLPDLQQYFKVLSLDFGGKSILELRPEGYLITSKTGNVCFGILNAKDTSLPFLNIIGDISMQGYLIVYDKVQDKMGWIRKDCNNLLPTRPPRFT